MKIDKNFYKNSSFKLGILSIIVLTSLLISSFMFNSQIEKLKKRIDYIYFGNYIPVLKLHTIEDSLNGLIVCMRTFKKCEREPYFSKIKEEWSYYNNSFKNDEERIVVDKISKDVFDSLNYNSMVPVYLDVIKKINFLKEHEKNVATEKRKAFLKEYSSMKDYLFYNSVILVFVSFILIVLIIYSVIKKDNQLKILTRKYKMESITDSMTTLYNRKYFDQIFDNMPFITNSNKWESAFIILDIDFFKQYNDTYGHDMGDITLKSVATALKSYFDKEYEYVFRLGGEEFGVILFDIDREILENCLSDVNNIIESLNIEHKNSKISNVVTISIGAVIYKANSYISGNRLYKMADQSLYHSKENGRNRYTIYENQEGN